MYIIVGLGNPGKQYEKTRHNMGFVAIDKIAHELGVKVNKIKAKSLIGEANIAGEKIVLVKPQTYMNLSGEAVFELLSYYKLSTENLIVIYDDIDISQGNIRIRKSGGAGTHNGMRSVVSSINSKNFIRIRVGIGTEHKQNIISYVIGGSISKKDKEILDKGTTSAAESIFDIVTVGIDKAMNIHNSKKNKSEGVII